MSKDKVISIHSKGTWTGDYGVNYEFEIEMENGDKGEYSSNKFETESDSGFPFKVGEEAEYECFVVKGYSKIKPIRTNPFRSATSTETALSETALKCATQLVCAKEVTYDNILITANSFLEWLKTNK